MAHQFISYRSNLTNFVLKITHLFESAITHKLIIHLTVFNVIQTKSKLSYYFRYNISKVKSSFKIVLYITDNIFTRIPDIFKILKYLTAYIESSFPQNPHKSFGIKGISPRPGRGYGYDIDLCYSFSIEGVQGILYPHRGEQSVNA